MTCHHPVYHDDDDSVGLVKSSLVIYCCQTHSFYKTFRFCRSWKVFAVQHILRILPNFQTIFWYIYFFSMSSTDLADNV
jgi:hypothetical protein